MSWLNIDFHKLLRITPLQSGVFLCLPFISRDKPLVPIIEPDVPKGPNKWDEWCMMMLEALMRTEYNWGVTPMVLKVLLDKDLK